MATFIYLDIETIPTQDAAAIEAIKVGVTAPAQYKKPESIAEWLAENRDTAAAEIVAKTSFDPAKGHICTIAWAKDDGEIQCAHAKTVQEETNALLAFFSDLDPYHSTQFVGHYIGGFDLRFILCRAVVLGVKIPRCIPRDPKPWSDSLFDTMQAWAGQKGTISQDNLAQALGLAGKGDFDGSKVAAAWAAGNHQTIIDYCKNDCATVREIHRKFVAANW
jgi:DNA polymerase elongation subunit (family B)